MTALLAPPPRRTVVPVADPVRADRSRSGDELHLARLVAGDDRALGAVYDEYGAAVLATARRVTVNDQLAGEVAQDVFVFLWEFPERVDLTRGSLRSYLCVIAHRRAVDAVRRSERRTRAELAASSGDELVDAPEDGVAAADAALWCHDRLVEALDQLPPEQREALTLTYLEGRTLRQAAADLGIPEGTAKSRVRLALARVRTLVGDDLRSAIR
jgi:RNA polymerase sigma-70 factor (ECF subfamily)